MAGARRLADLRRFAACSESGLPSGSASAAHIAQNLAALRRGFRTSAVSLQQHVKKESAQQKVAPPKHLSAEEVTAAVQSAQTKVFGTAFPGNLRTGRKRLRALLKGPSLKNWYGYTFDDILPEAMTEMKEEYYRDEEQLNRLGKSRITGKMKDPLKTKVDIMQFEDMIEGVADSIEDVNPEEFLTDMELASREMELAEAQSQVQVDTINTFYTRLVAHRERNIERVMAEAEAEGAARGETDAAVGADGKPKKKTAGNFALRQGLNDKKQWGADSKTSKKSSDEDKGKGSPARDTAAPGPAAGDEGETGGAAADPASAGDAEAQTAEGTEGQYASEIDDFAALATDMEGFSEDSDPMVRGLATAVMQGSWRMDRTLVKEVLSGSATDEIKKQVDASYAEHVETQASALWDALEALKNDAMYGIVYSEYEGTLQEQGHPMTADGVKAWIMKDEAAKAAAMQFIAARGAGSSAKNGQ